MSSIRQQESNMPSGAGSSPDAPTILPESDAPGVTGTESDADSSATIGFSGGRHSNSDIDLAGVPHELADHPRYRVVRKLGAGGMGDVYLAEHRVMMRPVAIKTINPALVRNQQLIERFQREIRAAAALAHPNIVAAFDAEQAGHLHFLVMEYVEGTDLSHLLRENGPLTCAKACHYVRQAAIGLQHAFEKGMAHRDIKPHNLILAAKNQIKILDFGLARIASTSDLGEGLTEVGSYMGTADYIAPEQASDARSADTRADIYSLGCTLYQLLSGRVPFEGGSNIDKIVRHINATPTPIEQLRPDMPPDLAAIVRKMMAKEMTQRYQQPIEVAKAIEPILRVLTTRNPSSEGETVGGRLGQKTPSGSRAVVDRNAETDPQLAVVRSAETGSRRSPAKMSQSTSETEIPKWLWAVAGIVAAAIGYWGISSAFNRPTKPMSDASAATPEAKPPATPEIPPPAFADVSEKPIPPPEPSIVVSPKPLKTNLLNGAQLAPLSAERIIQAGRTTVIAEASMESVREWVESVRGRNKVVNQLRAQTVNGKLGFFAVGHEIERPGNAEVEFDLDAGQLRDRIEKRKAAGMRVRSSTVYVVRDKPKFAVVWGRLAPAEFAEFSTDLTLEQCQRLIEESSNGIGWGAFQGYAIGDQERYFVYRSKPGGSGNVQSRTVNTAFAPQFRSEMEKIHTEHPDWMPFEISMWNQRRGRRFAAGFAANPRKIEWMADYEVPSTALASKIQERIGQGRTLKTMAANEKQGVAMYAIIWIQRANEEAEPAVEPEIKSKDSKKETAKKRGVRKKGTKG